MEFFSPEDQAFNLELKTEVDRILQNLVDQLKRELERQGHVLTGKLRDSLEIVIKDLTSFISGDFEAVILAEDYWRVINDGVRNVPFSGATGSQTRSKYIAGLRRFFRLLGFTTGSRNKRLAFATAFAQKKEKIPTKGSQSFSSVNRRRGFANVVLGKNLQVIDRRVERAMVKATEKYFVNKFNFKDDAS